MAVSRCDGVATSSGAVVGCASVGGELIATAGLAPCGYNELEVGWHSAASSSAGVGCIAMDGDEDEAVVDAPPNAAVLDSTADAHMRGLLRWFQQEEFVTSLAEWSWDWCMEFPRSCPAVTSSEHSFVFTEAHRQYREIFEVRAQEYLQRVGLASEHFLALAVEFLERQPNAAGVNEVFEGLVASESYESFFEYMCSVRKRREWAESTLCGSSDEIDWTLLVRRALKSHFGDVTVGDESDVESIE